MKLIHFTFHSGCDNEIKFVCKYLGHELSTIHVDDDTKTNDKYNVYHTKSNYYYNKYINQVKDYDGIITSDTSPLARPWLEFEWNKPVIIWICNRFDYNDRSFNIEKFPDVDYYDLYNKAYLRPNIKFVGYTVFELLYSRLRQCNLGELIIKPIGLRLNTKTVIPMNNQDKVFIPPYHNDIVTERNCKLVNINCYRGRYEHPTDLLSYKAIVHIPYAWSNLALFENLQLEIVYFIPDIDFFIEIVKEGIKTVENREFFWSPPFLLEYLKCSEWYCKENEECFVYFSSWNDLKQKIQTTDYEKKCNIIKNWNILHTTTMLNRWTDLFNSLNHKKHFMDSIDKVFYINLEKRSDRRLQIEKELSDYNIPKDKIERFNAITHTNGAVGCGRSHVEIYKIAKSRNYKNILIVEDDFKFIIDPENFKNQIETFFNKNIDFKIIMLSYNLFKSEDYDNQVGYVKDAQTTSGYIINHKYYDEFIDVIERAMNTFEQINIPYLYAIDGAYGWKQLQKEKFFYFKTRIGIQRESYSDIEGRITNYGV